jgi:hypothetical protein
MKKRRKAINIPSFRILTQCVITEIKFPSMKTMNNNRKKKKKLYVTMKRVSSTYNTLILGEKKAEKET